MIDHTLYTYQKGAIFLLYILRDISCDSFKECTEITLMFTISSSCFSQMYLTLPTTNSHFYKMYSLV